MLMEMHALLVELDDISGSCMTAACLDAVEQLHALHTQTRYESAQHKLPQIENTPSTYIRISS